MQQPYMNTAGALMQCGARRKAREREREREREEACSSPYFARAAEEREMGSRELVCVTGATGYLGSWLVKRLLEKGYRVRAVLRDPVDPKKMTMLTHLSGANKRLQIVGGDILQEGGLDDAMNGCDGVFHCACPIPNSSKDPHEDCIELYMNATINLLKACSKAPSIRRIIFTSSASTVRFAQLENIPGQQLTESCWTNIEICKRDKPHLWNYFASRSLSEKKALDLAQEYKLDLIAILPALVIGPFLHEHIPNSIECAISLVTGNTQHYQLIRHISYVHIDDVIDASIFLYETLAAQGRYIVSYAEASIMEVAQLLKKLYPTIKLPPNLDDVGEIVPQSMDNSKLKDLGFEFKHDLANMFESTIKCCEEKGLLQYLGQAP